MSWDDQIGGYDASIPAPVLDDASLRWPAMILYANIKRYAWKSGFCYATNATLLRAMSRQDPKTGAMSIPSERSLQSWLSELREHGHIRVDTGPIPPGKDGQRRIGRRIFVGITLADIPESGGEENCTPEDFCAEGVQKSAPHTTYLKIKKESNIPPKPPQGPDTWEMFEQFWAAYPRRRYKPRARRAWEKLSPDMATCNAILAALASFKASKQWTKDDGRYIPHPATWLNGRGWEDDPGPMNDSPPRPPVLEEEGVTYF